MTSKSITYLRNILYVFIVLVVFTLTIMPRAGFAVARSLNVTYPLGMVNGILTACSTHHGCNDMFSNSPSCINISSGSGGFAVTEGEPTYKSGCMTINYVPTVSPNQQVVKFDASCRAYGIKPSYATPYGAEFAYDSQQEYELWTMKVTIIQDGQYSYTYYCDIYAGPYKSNN